MFVVWYVVIFLFEYRFVKTRESITEVDFHKTNFGSVDDAKKNGTYGSRLP